MSTDANRSLTGIRVLDLTHTLAGPICTRVLADLGAEVVKVEAPQGDQTRPFPPVVGHSGAFFHHANAGKLGVCLDIRTEHGAELVARLAEHADVFVENWRPGVLAARGLGAEQLRARNPRLVYCSISGWGQTGPWAGRRAYAPLIHAEAGTIELAARLRGGEPRAEVHQMADINGGMAAVAAILAALFQRERNGTGQHLDVSMAEAQLFVNEQLANDLARFDGDRQMDSWNFPILPIGDGSLVCLVSNPVRGFLTWTAALGDNSFESDARFATWESRAEHKPAMLAILTRLLANYPSFEALEAAVAEAPVFVCAVRSSLDLAETEWARERQTFTELTPGVRIPAALFRSDSAATAVQSAAPALGEHTDDVLTRWLGLPPPG